MKDMILQGDLDVACAGDAAEAVRHWRAALAASEVDADGVTFELTNSMPTQVALQLFFATARSLDRTSGVSFGPNASALLTKASFKDGKSPNDQDDTYD